MGATITPQHIWVEASGTVPITNFPPSFQRGYAKEGTGDLATISIVPYDKSRHGSVGSTVNPYSSGARACDRVGSTCALVGGFEVH